MAQYPAPYPRMDPYKRSRYEQGIDAKIVVMGNTGVGKTSLLHRYTQNKFDPKNTTSTTGAFFVSKKINVDGLKVRLQLWDTAGQERFRSMAPMYYRGANAALLLYDITNVSTFNDIRGWLEELRKNCSPDLIIYIVGSKADLHNQRQVTPDLARLSLSRWFPPPRIPTPPPPPQPSTLSYIRPRFTSFTSIRSSPPSTQPSESPPHNDPLPTRVTGLKRSKTGTSNPRSRATTGLPITRSNTTSPAVRPPQISRFQSAFGVPGGGGWNEIVDTSSVSLNEEEEELDVEDQEWGLHKGMELFEVSAKSDTGINNLFGALISAIILKKDSIELENDMKKRDSVFLSPSSTPTWSAQAEEEEAYEKARSAGGWSCCSS